MVALSENPSAEMMAVSMVACLVDQTVDQTVALLAAWKVAQTVLT